MYKAFALAALLAPPVEPMSDLQTVLEALRRNPPLVDPSGCTAYEGGFKEAVEETVAASTSLRLVTCGSEPPLLIIDNVLVAEG